jgi:radical SAM superfamily enzyme
VQLLDQDAYVSAVVDFLEWLAPTCVVERLCGDAPPEYLVAPAWCADKAAVRAAIAAELRARDTWQGRRLET